MSNRYRLAVYVEFVTVDDPAARSAVTRNMDALNEVASSLRMCVRDRKLPMTAVEQSTYIVQLLEDSAAKVKLKLQRLNDDTPPRALLVETL